MLLKELVTVALVGVVAGLAGAQPGSEDWLRDRAIYQFLLQNRGAITRVVKKLPAGVETLTESARPEVAVKIHEHVAGMHSRLQEGRPLHLRDPLFAALFGSAKEIQMKIEKTERGVRVRETSTNPYVVRLIQAHAEVVSLFVAHGPLEVKKNHPVPPR